MSPQHQHVPFTPHSCQPSMLRQPRTTLWRITPRTSQSWTTEQHTASFLLLGWGQRSVRKPRGFTDLVCLWRYLWTTNDHAMCTLPSPKAAQKIQRDECAEANPSGAQDGPQPCPSPLTVQICIICSRGWKEPKRYPCFTGRSTDQ